MNKLGKSNDKDMEKTDTPECSLEEAFEQIEATIARLEDEDITLEDSFRAYQDGMKLLKYCNEKIDRVEKQVLKINEDGELDEF
ncbi:MAG: exodeoxyribonuclease VII small subunit [Lachnospiraceae bacterium]|nr:exodeoxyribonuclease VII small subunit [Lachnospiraceae bacterium]